MSSSPEEPPHDAAQRLRQLFWCMLLANVAVLCVLWLLVPGIRQHLTDEDLELENCGTLLFLGGGVLGVVALLLPWQNRARLAHGVIPVLSFLAFLDEIDYGERWLGYKKLQLWGYEVDGIHDIFGVLMKLWRDEGNPALDVAIFVLLGGLISVAFLQRRLYMPQIMAYVRHYPAFDYVRLAVILIGAAMLLDVNILDHPFSFFLEELFEANGALALLFAAGVMFVSRRMPPWNHTPASS